MGFVIESGPMTHRFFFAFFYPSHLAEETG
jgi:hypothetical protein